MFKLRLYIGVSLLGFILCMTACKAPALVEAPPPRTVPLAYGTGSDTTNMGAMSWRQFFTDPYLIQLIDSALINNQELSIAQQEIEIARNEIKARQGAILPFVTGRAGIGMEKVGRYTSQGAGDASTEIVDGKEVPDILPDYTGALYATWEADIWNKLHNAKKAAVTRYLSTVEGRNFITTNLVGEVASTYYELRALDNQLQVVRQSIALQKNALDLVKVQKEAARITELAVQKFQAEVLSSQSLEYGILQKIREAENKLALLSGKYPTSVLRDTTSFVNLQPFYVASGIPSQLLANRPDIRKAELDLEAAKLDVKVARAEFYPSLGITAGLGLQAFNPTYLVKFPESILFSLAGDLAGPLINKSAIKAEFYSANARQLQALFDYDRTVLNAYLEVSTGLSNIDNLQKSYVLKSQQVDALMHSIDISNDLFRSARADYLEVLMTQRDALDARLELIENKRDQMMAVVDVYKALGGGWK